jgi:hypothetical protein
VTKVKLVKFPVASDEFDGFQIPESRIPAELAEIVLSRLSILPSMNNDLTIDKLMEEELTWSQIVSLLYMAGLRDRQIEGK